MLNPRSLAIDPGPMTVLTAKANLYSHFKFFVMKCNQYWLDGQWQVIRDYDTEPTCGYQATEPGLYLFAIHMAQDPENPEINAPGGMLTMTLGEGDMAIAQPGDDSWIPWIEEVTDYWTLPANCVQMKQGHLRAMQYVLKWMYCFHHGPS
ncbi:MAG: hypothetical protein SV775_17935, partial [Thermodesulfobacteriota bacterium]|nr:hypothetical protein [Thermodesulfobacteriota bacterium]